MRKRIWSAAVVAALLSAGGLMLGIPRVLAATSSVNMVEGSPSDYHTWKFDPVEITVPAGTTVVWTNKGESEHTTTAADKSWDSGTLSKGATFQHAFPTAGDFNYV